MVHMQNESTISILESENVGASDARIVVEELGRENEFLKRELEDAERRAKEMGREVRLGHEISNHSQPTLFYHTYPLPHTHTHAV